MKSFRRLRAWLAGVIDPGHRDMREALARHSEWCGYNRHAPGNPICRQPAVSEPLNEDLERCSL